jgi:hypothetical protein
MILDTLVPVTSAENTAARVPKAAMIGFTVMMILDVAFA